MWRCDSVFSAGMVEEVAKTIGVKPVWARARCQHGYTRQETCVECEGGYVDDIHAFAATRSAPASFHTASLLGVTDDGEDAVYIPYKYQVKVNKRSDEIEVIYNKAARR